MTLQVHEARASIDFCDVHRGWPSRHVRGVHDRRIDGPPWPRCTASTMSMMPAPFSRPSGRN